jgi:hypothetical protein
MPTIKSPIFYIVILLFIVLQACDGVYKPSSRGKISEVLIVMDASKWNSDLGDALRNSFGADIKTMPDLSLCTTFDLPTSGTMLTLKA